MGLGPRRTLLGAIAVAAAALAALVSGTIAGIVAAAVGLLAGWIALRILIRTGDARARPESSPIVPGRGTMTLIASFGIAAWFAVAAVADAVSPGSGKDVVGAAILGFLGGLLLGLRSSALAAASFLEPPAPNSPLH